MTEGPAPDLHHRPSDPPVLTVGSVRPVQEIIAASRLSPERLLRQAGLAADLFAQPDDALLPLADYFRLCEQMALQGDDESCHISLRPLMAGTSELVQARLLGCRTLAGLLDVIANSYNIIHGRRYNRVSRRGALVSYEIDDTDFPYALGHDAPFVILSLECLLVYVHMLLLSAVPEGADIRLRRLTTRGSAQGPGTHLRFWQVPIRHEAPGFALVYEGDPDEVPVTPQSSLVINARTIYGGVADMLESLRPPPRTDRLADRVMRLIAGRQADQAAAARHLGISVATLRRALEAEGTSFRELRVAVLNRDAQAALREGRSIGDVAEMLAFSDGRSFARAFRLWNGVSPGDYRRAADDERNCPIGADR